MPGQPTKRKALGNWGEDVAVAYLVGQGYSIMAQQWRMGHLEIDIIARTGKYVVFVEVKTRSSAEADPVDAVNQRKRAKMVASAHAFMQHYDLPFEYRFDIIAITGTKESYTVEHIPDAFLPPLKRFSYTFRL